MKNNFENIKLEELCDYIGRGISPQYVEHDGDIVINQKCVRDNRVDLQPARCFDKNQKVSQNKYLKNNDILINSTGTGTLGRTAQIQNVSGKTTVDSHVTIVRLKEFVNSKYVAHYLSLNEPYIESLGKGSTNQIELSSKDVGSIIINLPSRNIQDEIADVISSYGSLIENNNKRIELLEKMAQEIYKEWFIRMRFPGYEKVKFDKGIPLGWKYVELKCFGKVVTGKTPSTDVTTYFGGDIPFIKTPDMHGNMFVLRTEETLTELGANSQKGCWIPENSICVNCIGARSGSVSITVEKSQTNQQINSIILNNINDLEYLYFSATYLKPTIELFGATGATMTNLSKGKFEKLKILLADKKTILAFNSIVGPMFNEIKSLGKANINLSKTRDLLLPRLMSGKLSLE